MDPTLPHMFAALLAIVFLGGAWQKLRDMDSLATACCSCRWRRARRAPVSPWPCWRR